MRFAIYISDVEILIVAGRYIRFLLLNIVAIHNIRRRLSMPEGINEVKCLYTILQHCKTRYNEFNNKVIRRKSTLKQMVACLLFSLYVRRRILYYLSVCLLEVFGKQTIFGNPRSSFGVISSGRKSAP